MNDFEPTLNAIDGVTASLALPGLHPALIQLISALFFCQQRLIKLLKRLTVAWNISQPKLACYTLLPEAELLSLPNIRILPSRLIPSVRRFPFSFCASMDIG